ncbi:methyl-accepting chemotaxis protein [Variovorax ginsengisoli]|uniref:Methyl-accepting chemotaxis protein n=1 Tax=Variovorax ginsengisoli TaxID=363844 RepID=A0ABT9SCJ6_9BURK|nr:methyl-accepting chemotaxis protein [Variovorax ginsengisoli]MDP9901102.1 methyl-accepting chemotaxis protein [Variovorax ginsengisoli]
MNWLKKSTISARMLALTLLCALLTMTVGVVGLNRTSAMGELLTGMFDNNLTPVADVANANMQAIYHNRGLFAHIAATDAAATTKISENIKKSEVQMNALLDKYRKTYLTPREVELLGQFDKAWPPYRELAETALRLDREEKDAEALALMTSSVTPAFQKVDDLLSDLVDFNVELGKKANQEGGDVAASSRHAIWTLIALALALSTIISLLISRSITRPLGGEPSQVVDAANAIAEGDLSRTIAVKSGDSESAVARMAVMQENLAKVVHTVRHNAESVAAASSQIAQGNQDLSSRTEEQASALEETAASMEQLSTTVKQNADNAQQANQLSQTASKVAEQGGSVVSRVVGTMREINESSRRISDIISVIDGIAFQTNILALNAAVEAARAGEQGRGFAVVAGEVRTLAQRSAEAAKEIKALIATSVGRVAQGSSLVDEAGRTMEDVVRSIGQVNQIVAGISRASGEQSTGVTQIGEAIGQMDEATQQDAALVEQSAAAAQNLRDQAQQLVQAVAVFKLSGGPREPVMAEIRPAPSVTKPNAAGPVASITRVKKPAPQPEKTTEEEWATF